MKRSLQEIVELVVFGLIALLIGTGVLWLLGAIFGLVGTVLGWLAALLWGLLAFLVPVALVAGAVVLIIRWAQGRPMPGTAGRAQPSTAPPPVPPAEPVPTTHPAEPTTTVDPNPPFRPSPPPSPSTSPAGDRSAKPPEESLDRERAADSTSEGMPPAPPGTPPVEPDAPTDGTERPAQSPDDDDARREG